MTWVMRIYGLGDELVAEIPHPNATESLLEATWWDET